MKTYIPPKHFFLTRGMSKRGSSLRNPSPHFHSLTLPLWEPAENKAHESPLLFSESKQVKKDPLPRSGQMAVLEIKPTFPNNLSPKKLEPIEFIPELQ